MNKPPTQETSSQAVQKFKLTVNAKQAERHAEVAKRRAQLAKGQLKAAKKAFKLARKLAKKAAKKARHLVEELDSWLQQNKKAARKRPVPTRRQSAKRKKVQRPARTVSRKKTKRKIAPNLEPVAMPPMSPGVLPPV